MKIKSIGASRLAIPFKVSFKHASAARASTETIWIKVIASDGTVSYGEGCPRSYVTQESLDSAERFIATHLHDWRENLHDLATLKNWVQQHRAEIDKNPSAWTAVEIALLDLLGKERRCSVESLLGLPELSGDFHYTAVMGDASIEAFEAQLAAYQHAGFRDFKIKLSGDLTRDMEKVRALRAGNISKHMVRADANNLWHHADEAIRHIEALAFSFHAIEEPLQASDYDGMLKVAACLNTTIILDESFLRTGQLEFLQGSEKSWVINLRVSKMGGILRSLELFEMARQQKISIIVGAHVGETSVLTRAALTVANQAHETLLAQEGAFGTHLLSSDVVARPLMFGKGGVLKIDAAPLSGSGGFGLDVVENLPVTWE